MLKLASICMLALAVSGAAGAADVAAGKAIVTKTCSKCHVKEDREGTDAAALSSKIHEIVAGKHKHKIPLKLTDADIANVAAYWVSD
jgi:mono/diheme cytochrome c family protein